jgi:transketolase
MANAIRALAMDAVQKANSGHPGMPMGMAEIAVALWSGHYSHNPANPKWVNRDRFLLSNGHGSMLHYALLHLTATTCRWMTSRTSASCIRRPRATRKSASPRAWKPPPARWARVSPTRSAWRWRSGCWQRIQQAGHDVVDHYTYAFVGDGCLMEGISHEVCALAGTLGLKS